MWVGFALFSAFLLGLYDASKKHSLRDNAVLPILWLNTLFCSLLLLPPVLLSRFGAIDPEALLYVPSYGHQMHLMLFLKAALVLGSWICGYIGLKHLPITIVGPINATRPVMVLLGGTLLLGERLNPYQWIGVGIAIFSFYMLNRSSKREGIDFKTNKWLVYTIIANILGAISAMYDKILMAQVSNMFVQAWSNFYQVIIMTVLLMLMWYPTRKKTTPFQWRWPIILISVFITLADFTYFYALTDQSSMISIVSMIRRSSVVVSFACGALMFHEKNLRYKATDLILVLIGLVFLLIGSLQ